MTTITATDARQNLFDLIKGAVEKHLVYHIRHRKGGVVLLSEEEYDSLIETLELLETPGLKKSLQRSLKQMDAGETYSMDDVFGGTE